jgi:hypothetical protein
VHGYEADGYPQVNESGSGACHVTALAAAVSRLHKTPRRKTQEKSCTGAGIFLLRGLKSLTAFRTGTVLQYHYRVPVPDFMGAGGIWRQTFAPIKVFPGMKAGDPHHQSPEQHCRVRKKPRNRLKFKNTEREGYSLPAL